MCPWKIAAVRQNDDVPGPDDLAELVAGASPTASAVVDDGRVVLWANRAFTELVSVEPVGRSLADLGDIGPDLAAVADDLDGSTMSSRATSNVPGPEGTRWFDIDCRTLTPNDTVLVSVHELTGVVNDLGGTVPASDPLTGLPGRETAERFLADAAHRSPLGTVGVSSIDLDQYEIVARALGHDAADELAQRAGRLLASHAPQGSLLARIPPSSFLLVHEAAEVTEFDRLASTLRDAIRQPIDLRGRTLRITASVGTSIVNSADEAALALQQAATAMLEASSRGGNRCVHHSAHDAASPTTVVQLWNALRTAVQYRHMEVWYQPLVSLGSGKPVGVEALCRWHHPQMGDIAPSTFIPLAEQNSEIIAIGSFVLDRAGSFLRSLRTDRTLPRSDFQVVVNASSSELAWPGFAQGVLQRVDGHDLRPEWFVLDIPETALFAAEPAVADNLRMLAEAGVTLSVDDFGTGMSTISRLAAMGVRRVTIDRRMISRIGEDQATQRLVASMISLASDLGFVTVAKGVETHEQLAALRAMGCRAAQGFLFAPAVTELEIPAVLHELHRSASTL
ncbi:MAG: hypothetical protein RLZ04_227 [Actinomycetota bacterium]